MNGTGPMSICCCYVAWSTKTLSKRFGVISTINNKHYRNSNRKPESMCIQVCEEPQKQLSKAILRFRFVRQIGRKCWPCISTNRYPFNEVIVPFCSLHHVYYQMSNKNKKFRVRPPGIEPGSNAWQASIITLRPWTLMTDMNYWTLRSLYTMHLQNSFISNIG